MKSKLFTIAAVLLLGAFPIFGQGTFIYDQQSAFDDSISAGLTGIQTNNIIGQSFTPTLNSVGFIRLLVSDVHPGNSLGATLFINVRANAIDDPVIGSANGISMADGFGYGYNGVVTFFLTVPPTVTAGSQYFFDVTAQAGSDSWAVGAYGFNYQGGALFRNGIADTGPGDMWFREGIVATPEPSTWALGVLGMGLFAGVHYAKSRRQKRSLKP